MYCLLPSKVGLQLSEFTIFKFGLSFQLEFGGVQFSHFKSLVYCLLTSKVVVQFTNFKFDLSFPT